MRFNNARGMFRFGLAAAAVSVALTGPVSTASALDKVTIRFASDLTGPPHPAAISKEYFRELIEERLPGSKVQTFYAGALYNFENTLEGIADGIGDLGWVGTLWEPNKLPLQNVTFVMPFVTGNVKLAADIQNALHRDIPEMKQAFLDNNQIYLGPQSIDDYVIVSKTPINSVADMKGKKFYAPGASAAWLEGTGAIGVNGGLPVYYNGIQTGVTGFQG